VNVNADNISDNMLKEVV